MEHGMFYLGKEKKKENQTTFWQNNSCDQFIDWHGPTKGGWLTSNSMYIRRTSQSGKGLLSGIRQHLRSKGRADRSSTNTVLDGPQCTAALNSYLSIPFFVISVLAREKHESPGTVLGCEAALAEVATLGIGRSRDSRRLRTTFSLLCSTRPRGISCGA